MARETFTQDWSNDWRGYASREDRDADILAEDRLASIRKLAEGDYWHAVRCAKDRHDFTCGAAVAQFGHGSIQHSDAIDAAREAFEAAISAARIAKLARIAQLIANDNTSEDDLDDTLAVIAPELQAAE